MAEQQDQQKSVFFDEWIKSLREQYKYVIRNNDQVTLPSLTQVMGKVGFSDDELTQLRVEATMHVDEVGTDYVADMNVLDTSQPHPAECTCGQCIPIDESLYDDEGQPLTDIDPEEATHETGHIFEVAKLEPANDNLDDEPDVTFEDALIEEESDVVDNIEPDDAMDEEDDPDAPKQMSMF